MPPVTRCLEPHPAKTGRKRPPLDLQHGTVAALHPRTPRGSDKPKDTGNKRKSKCPAGKDNPRDIFYYTRKLSKVQGQSCAAEDTESSEIQKDTGSDLGAEEDNISLPDFEHLPGCEDIAEGEVQPILNHILQADHLEGLKEEVSLL